jgi:hypothetical protein
MVSPHLFRNLFAGAWLDNHPENIWVLHTDVANYDPHLLSAPR